MKATTDLENDHVYILKLCDIMEKITHGERLELSHIEDIVDLIRSYADGLHHKKEEDLLFPKMSEKGFPLKSGPIAVMLMDHEAGRSYVKGIAEGVIAYKSGDTGSKKEIFGNMLGYVELLRNHIAKENNILFRMADNCLSDEEQQLLLDEFGDAEKSHKEKGTTAGYISRINKLAGVYGL
jgi:hemerythrin-like domain-containing protein